MDLQTIVMKKIFLIAAILHSHLVGMLTGPKALFKHDDNLLTSIEFPFTVMNAETDNNKILKMGVPSMTLALN